MSDKADKRRLLEEKKRRWMNEREAALHPSNSWNQPNDPQHSIRSSGYNSTSGGTNYNNISSSNNYNSNNRLSSGTPDILTAEMTNVIREQISKELRNNQYNYQTRDVNQNNSNQALEEYVLQQEAQSHTCKICFEIMVSPRRTPMILYPCGHTFCKECMIQHADRASNNSKPNCPYCRTAIESLIPNQAMKEMIEQYMERKAQLLPPIRKPNEAELQMQQQEHYKTVKSACEIRISIIQEELREHQYNLDIHLKKKESLAKAKSHLETEKQSINDRIQELQEELILIDEHLESQSGKQIENEANIQDMEESIQLLKNTYHDLQRQIEKASVFTT